MLDINKSTFVNTIQFEVVTGTVKLEEGTALVYQLENGKMKVKPSTGAQYEVYAGMAIGRASVPSVVPLVETITVPATGPYTAELSKTPAGVVGATVLVNSSTRTPLTVGAVGVSNFSRSGNVMTFDSSFAGKDVEVRSTYEISLREAQLLFHFDVFATVDYSVVPVTGAVVNGIFYTSMYDPLADWASIGVGGAAVTLGANGLYTIGGAGTALPGFVYETPSVSGNGMLGLIFDAA